MSGLQYDYFVPANQKVAPYILNTRIYSCILLDNSIEHRWRGRYNEDSDLSIRILKDGWCSVLLQAFVCGKVSTLTMKGGNTQEIYKHGQADSDNRYAFAKSLYDQHPDIVEIVERYGRWHHKIDFSGFKKNKLIPIEGLQIPREPNEYGLVLKSHTEGSENV